MNTRKTKSVLIAPMQSVGRCGKSTLMQAFIEYFKFAEVKTGTLDMDSEHKTLSSWYPEAVFMPFHEAKDWLPVLNHCGSSPVEIIDFPAQATDEILAGLEQFKADAIFKEKEIQVLIPLFASDEAPAMQSAAKILAKTNHFAKYFIVTNPAKYTSEKFLASEKLKSMYKDSPIINLPKITEETLAVVHEAIRKKRKHLTFKEAIPHVPIASKMELETWSNQVLCQLENVASILVPDSKLIKNKLSRETSETTEEIDPFDL